MTLANQNIEFTGEGTPPLSQVAVRQLASEIPQWHVKERMLDRDFKFNNFEQAMEFVNRVANIAREVDHHPDITISYNKVHLELCTHKIGGLTRNDFVVAARINQLYQ